MNDLDTIHRKNTEAIERAIPDQLAKGKWAVAEYTGLSFTGAQFFDAEVDAARHACAIGLRVGQRARVHSPAALDNLVASDPVADLSMEIPSSLGGLTD
jgi:hypothetical protein